MLGYALFYFVRKNLSVAMPEMEKSLKIGKEQLGGFLTLHGLLYGVSKFINGMFGDQANPRYFMALGLVCSAAMSICFGLSSAVWTFGLFWLLNGWFQGMGFPPCARAMTHWFSPKELATKLSIWNTSHSIGAGLVVILCGWLVTHFTGVMDQPWRLCFFVPAGMAALGALFLLVALRDSPESMGLPPVEEYRGEQQPTSDAPARKKDDSFRALIKRNVFLNPWIWLIAVSNFFVYTVRYAILDWGPTFLTQTRGVDLKAASWMVAGYEFFGIAGMLLGGVLTDYVFRGYGSRACVVYMALCGVSLLAFWRLPIASPYVNAALLCSAGFFIYGPQCLVGVIVANIATKRAAATAIGVTGLFGYLSTILSGWGLGKLVDAHGWNAGYAVLVASAAIATVLFAIAWAAHSPQEESSQGAS
jgi:OPA family glycerol-3-phosphate transporter-like MFS transporter/OPA family sugar phosphate sensor protein UhpC-like MFS transporter